MALFSPIRSSVVIRLNMGANAEGMIVVRPVTVSRVDPTIDADSLKSVTDALGELLAFPVFAVERVSTDSVEM